MIPKMMFGVWGCLISTLVLLVEGYRYDPAYTQYNLNTNETATHPLDYWGEWDGHNYTASPENWRFPFYTLFLDRFVNGDPSNDNINGTAFEHDLSSSQMRHGGDLQGLIDTLDYLQGMGIKVRLSELHFNRSDLALGYFGSNILHPQSYTTVALPGSGYILPSTYPGLVTTLLPLPLSYNILTCSRASTLLVHPF